VPSTRTLDPVYGLANANINTLDTPAYTGARYWQGRRLPPPDSTRFNAMTATWECSQKAGITLKTGGSNGNTVMRIEYPTLYGDTIDVTLGDGYYASLKAVWLAVKAFLENFMPGSNWESPFEFLGSTSLFWIKETNFNGEVTVYTSDLLAQLFGYASAQGFTVTAVQATSHVSPYTHLCPDIQFSDIQLRAKNFGRRPL
jgi:hypothetical protein